MRTQGFTLIELLIVIAIIGILAAVLIPNLLGARQRAYDAAAQGCAKAIATGQETYQIDSGAYLSGWNSLLGTNACDSTTMSITTGAVTDSTYRFSVLHLNGRATFVVTDRGVSRP